MRRTAGGHPGRLRILFDRPYPGSTGTGNRGAGARPVDGDGVGGRRSCAGDEPETTETYTGTEGVAPKNARAGRTKLLREKKSACRTGVRGPQTTTGNA